MWAYESRWGHTHPCLLLFVRNCSTSRDHVHPVKYIFQQHTRARFRWKRQYQVLDCHTIPSDAGSMGIAASGAAALASASPRTAHLRRKSMLRLCAMRKSHGDRGRLSSNWSSLDTPQTAHLEPRPPRPSPGRPCGAVAMQSSTNVSDGFKERKILGVEWAVGRNSQILTAIYARRSL
jgi:hypothetical protein